MQTSTIQTRNSCHFAQLAKFMWTYFPDSLMNFNQVRSLFGVKTNYTGWPSLHRLASLCLLPRQDFSPSTGNSLSQWILITFLHTYNSIASVITASTWQWLLITIDTGDDTISGLPIMLVIARLGGQSIAFHPCMTFWGWHIDYNFLSCSVTVFRHARIDSLIYWGFYLDLSNLLGVCMSWTTWV